MLSLNFLLIDFFFLIKGKAGEVFRVDKRENTVI